MTKNNNVNNKHNTVLSLQIPQMTSQQATGLISAEDKALLAKILNQLAADADAAAEASEEQDEEQALEAAEAASSASAGEHAGVVGIDGQQWTVERVPRGLLFTQQAGDAA